MTTRKRRTATRTARRGRTAVPPAGGLRERWSATLAVLSAAEAEMEAQVRKLLKENRITASDTSDALRQLSRRLEKERVKAMRQLDSRLGVLQQRVDRERRQVSRMVDSAVESALAAVNVPTRREINELTRKVDALTQRIEGLRTPRRRSR